MKLRQDEALGVLDGRVDDIALPRCAHLGGHMLAKTCARPRTVKLASSSDALPPTPIDRNHADTRSTSTRVPLSLPPGCPFTTIGRRWK
jgi:hypothetical protein